MNVGSINWLGLTNSIIGIVGGVLFFLHRPQYRHFIYVWIYLQFILITKVTSMDGYETEVPIFDLTQFVKIKIGFSLALNETALSIAINILPFAYLYAFQKFQVKNLVGTALHVRLYRDNPILNGVLPQQIQVIQTVDFGKNNNWLLAQLSIPIVVDGISHNHCLIKGKDDEPIVPDKPRQMAHLRVVEQAAEPFAPKKLEEYRFIDWVFVH